MKRYEFISKEKIIESFSPNATCESCIAFDTCNKRCEIVTHSYCNENIYEFLNEEINPEKKRRCDVYRTADELNDNYNYYCRSLTTCGECKYRASESCKIAYALDEVEFVNETEVLKQEEI